MIFRKYPGKPLIVTLVCTLCLLIGLQTGYAQTSPALRPWHSGPLTWVEFKGQPEKHDHIHGAVTYAGIALEILNIDFWGNVTFRAYAVFDGGRSWTKSGQGDEDLLAHEQLHFDIAEVYARRLEKKLNDMKLKRREARIAKKLHDQYNNEQLQVQARYDEETIHGLSKPIQARWAELVAQHLARVEDQIALTAKGKE